MWLSVTAVYCVMWCECSLLLMVVITYPSLIEDLHVGSFSAVFGMHLGINTVWVLTGVSALVPGVGLVRHLLGDTQTAGDEEGEQHPEHPDPCHPDLCHWCHSGLCWWLTGSCDWLVSVFMICDLFVWVRAWLLAACHGLSKQQLENEWSVSLSLSRLCSRPGPVARCRPEPSSARGRHIGGQQRMVSTSAPRSHQGQALNKQGVSVRRPGSGDSSDFHFRRTMLSRGKTENMGPGETAVWEPSVVPRVGGRRQILRIWSGITTGGLMSYISISVFAALSGFWSDRSLWAAQHERGGLVPRGSGGWHQRRRL